MTSRTLWNWAVFAAFVGFWLPAGALRVLVSVVLVIHGGVLIRDAVVWVRRRLLLADLMDALATYVETDDPTDPCSLCVQWRPQIGDDDQTDNWEPYWPDGSVVPRIWRGTHAGCQATVDQMQAEQTPENGYPA